MTSTITSVVDDAHTATRLCVSVELTVVTAIDCPAAQFRFDVFGYATPFLYTARNPLPAVLVTTTFNNTDDAPDGTPLLLPLQSTVRAVAATSGILGPTATGTRPSRESYTRTGTGNVTNADDTFDHLDAGPTPPA